MSKRIERFGESEATVTADEHRLTIEVVTLTPELTARLHLTHGEAWKLADAIHACLEDQQAANVKVGDWVTYNGARMQVQAVGNDGALTLGTPSHDGSVIASPFEVVAATYQQVKAAEAVATETDNAVGRVEEAPDFRMELTRLINRHSKENESNTPDLILADYLEDALNAFDRATRRRERWLKAGALALVDETNAPVIHRGERLSEAVCKCLDAHAVLSELERQWNTVPWTKRPIGLHDRIEAAKVVANTAEKTLWDMLPKPDSVIAPPLIVAVSVNGRWYQVSAAHVVSFNSSVLPFRVDITPADESAAP